MNYLKPGVSAFRPSFLGLVRALLSPMLSLPAFAASTITLAWDPSPDTDVAGYVLYWGTASGNYSASAEVGNQTTTDFSQLTPGVTLYFVVTAVNAQGLESDPSNEISYFEPLPNGLMASWAFDEPSGDVVVDAVAGNVGVGTNGVSRQEGVSGGALRFDGLDDVVTVPDSSSLTAGQGFALSGWFNASQPLDRTSGRRDLVAKSLSYRLMMNFPTADGRLTFALNSGTPLVQSATAVWEPDRWYHFVTTYDGSMLRLYIDGTLEGTASATVPPNDTATPLLFGGSTDPGHFFPGALDEIRLYGRALSASDVTGLYASYGRANNTAPQISPIADLDLAPGTASGPIRFLVGDPDSPPDSIRLTCRSSNPTLVPVNQVVFGGGGSNRTVTVSPAAGLTGQSVITVMASDGELAAEESFTVTVTTNPNTLKIEISGEGSVTPDLDGKPLVLGRAYLVTARPAAGFLFAGWSGAIHSSRASVRFVMQTNMTLAAQFVPNPFAAVAGVFNGLFHESDEVRHDTSGHLRVALASRGAYSALLRSGGRSYSWTGRFGLDGMATNVVRRRTALGDLVVELRLDPGNGSITGRVNHHGWQAAITADRAAFYTASNPSPYRARYTMLTIPMGEDLTSPGGTGIGRGLVNYRGLVVMGAVMADGQVISLSTPISRNGQWPFFANLNRGRGSVLGWANFVDRPGDDFHGLLSWSRPSSALAVFYPSGFTNDLQVVGSRYVPPSGASEKILDFSEGRLVLTGGNLADDLVKALTLEPRARIINRGDQALRITAELLGGGFVGSVREPENGRWISFRGAVFQKANHGAGFFRGVNQIGGVYLGP